MKIEAPSKRLFLALLLVLCAFTEPPSAHAQRSELPFLRVDWHLATIAEMQGRWADALRDYQRVIDETASLPLQIREWYRGTARFAMARCYCRLPDAAKTKEAMKDALEHHFWNSLLTRLDTTLINACGAHWIDSSLAYWLNVKTMERTYWTEQKQVIIAPPNIKSGEKLPLIIALHGGNANYLDFADAWFAIAKEEHAIVVVPPGIVRESEVTNSWETDFTAIDSLVSSIITTLGQNPLIDTNHVILTGYSQGAQASLYVSLKHPNVIRGAILFSGFAQHPLSQSEIDQSAKAGVRLYSFVGQYEEPMFATSIQEAATYLNENKVAFKIEHVDGMCHEVPLDLRTRFQTAWSWVNDTTQAINGKGE